MKRVRRWSKRLDYWLHFFGFKNREKSIKEKMCEATNDLVKEYKAEARQATRELRMKIESKSTNLAS
jgi:hypothetical protein